MQGREKDIVIFSAVRSSTQRKGKIGFVADERRVNVALTRARASLLVVANFKVLERDGHWSNLVKHATANKCGASHVHFISMSENVQSSGSKCTAQLAASLCQRSWGVGLLRRGSVEDMSSHAGSASSWNVSCDAWVRLCEGGCSSACLPAHDACMSGAQVPVRPTEALCGLPQQSHTGPGRAIGGSEQRWGKGLPLLASLPDLMRCICNFYKPTLNLLFLQDVLQQRKS